MRYLSFAILGAALIFAVVYFGRERSLEHCRSAASIRMYAPTLSDWIKDAENDPFELAMLRQEPIAKLVGELKARAKTGANSRPQWLISVKDRAGFRPMERANLNDTKGLKEALAAAAAVPVPIECLSGISPQLVKIGDAAAAYWAKRGTEVRLAKMSFARDKDIFCQSRGLLEKLRAVKVATEAQCQERKAKKSKACRAGALESVDQEITDLEKQKEFNLEKLRKKWPEAVLGEIPCL
jgi:hypothetical protein